MTLHAITDQDRSVLHEAFRTAAADPDLIDLLRRTDLSVQFVLGPGDQVVLDADGFPTGTPDPPGLRLEAAPATLHEILLGRLPVPLAVVHRRLAIKGPSSRVRLLGELLPIVGRHYARLSAGTAGPD